MLAQCPCRDKRGSNRLEAWFKILPLPRRKGKKSTARSSGSVEAMYDRRAPTDEDAVAARRLLLGAFETGADLGEVERELAWLHPRYNTFPGEVFVELGADALEVGGFRRGEPLSHEQLRDRFLSEYEFRGRELQKLRYALLCAAATKGGVEVDLLDEVAYWGSDDFWRYAMYAAIAYVRAAAGQLGVDLQEIARQLNRDDTSGG
jgi:hypothetical protein